MLSYFDLRELVRDGIIDAPVKNINGSSIEITLHDVIRIEVKPSLIDRVKSLFFGVNPVDLAGKKSIKTKEIVIGKNGYVLKPGEFILASSVETFNLPSDVSAQYSLKSTQGRNGMGHLLAGHCDATWKDSKITLEFHNVCRFHPLLLKPGMKCGQIIFHRHMPVPYHASYEAKGQYNHQHKVQESKGIK